MLLIWVLLLFWGRLWFLLAVQTFDVSSFSLLSKRTRARWLDADNFASWWHERVFLLDNTILLARSRRIHECSCARGGSFILWVFRWERFLFIVIILLRRSKYCILRQLIYSSWTSTRRVIIRMILLLAGIMIPISVCTSDSSICTLTLGLLYIAKFFPPKKTQTILNIRYSCLETEFLVQKRAFLLKIYTIFCV